MELTSSFLLLCVPSFILLASFPITTLASDHISKDLQALLAFKAGISNDPYKALESWNDSLNLCQWPGVTCGSLHKRVTVLNLNRKSLTGTISPHIGNLSFLRQLLLEDNDFHGKIPAEVSRLFRLQHLALSNNSLGGQIPANLSLCSNLKFLRLSINRLVGKIPVELSFLPKIILLAATRNNLSGEIPPSLGNLSSLHVLSLQQNALEGNIPETLGQLKNLRFLTLDENKLSGVVPPSLYNISSINTFSIASNQLHGSLLVDIRISFPNLQGFYVGMNRFHGPVPVSFSNASGLEILDMSSNSFSGPVPEDLGALQGLTWLNLGFNELGGDLNFLSALTNCTNLEKLGLNNNKMGGVLPSSVANLTAKLTALLIGTNQVHGSIPDGIENLVNLTVLGLEYNVFVGGIPDGIGKLQKLEGFGAQENKLSGQIPHTLGNLTQLSELYLQENDLYGTIPPSIGSCKKLQSLNLSRNNLNGTVPKQVIGLASLSIMLDLSHNSFTGPLPLEVGKLTNLGTLDISENKLSGEIPSALGDCISLELLHLDGNLFHGSIPFLSSLRVIRELDLSRNNLSGRIPNYLEKLPFLHYLNLSFNHLEGEVPEEGAFQNASQVSIVGNSKLCGGIIELQLPPCPVQESRNHRNSFPIKFMIVIIVSVLLITSLIVLVIFCWRRKSMSSKTKTPSSFMLGDRYLRISYKELLEATNGFSSANLIGVGSFGSVYEGLLQRNTPIAVKVLNLQQRGASKSFMVECNTLAKIRHRNLLKIITACSSMDFQGNDFKALVFEFMPNGNLETWLHSSLDDQQEPRNLSLEQRLKIAIDVASALYYLHCCCETPIVHCDLKPSNVLLDDDLNAHVGDFGLAKFLSGFSTNFGKDLSSSVALKGSIGYVPPEYGMGSEVSTRGDVYSYGILLLEMFTGKRPTAEMFKDGLSLHDLCKAALPDKLVEILDPHLLLEGYDEAELRQEIWSIRRDKTYECLAAILRIGVACSTELPGDRIDIGNVLDELSKIKVKVGSHEEN